MTAAKEKQDKPKAKQIQKPEKGEIVQFRYEVIQALGEGGFGAVFEVMDIKTSERHAMKMELEKQPDDEPGLDLEGAVLRRLQGYCHILRYVDEGEWGPDKHLFLIMELAGPSLASLRKSVKHRRFTNSTMARLGAQSLSAIEVVHVSGMLHRDIKPANFAVGHKDEAKRTVFILDFGMVRKHVLPNGQIRPARSSAGFRGSIQFASVKCHRNKDLGRCDDIWCWLYMMVQLRSGKLPWRDYTGKEKVGHVKRKTKKEELLKKMAPEFHTIYESLDTLEYADEPPYAAYHALLSKLMDRKHTKMDDPYDWEIPERVEPKEKTKKHAKKAPKSPKVEKTKLLDEKVKIKEIAGGIATHVPEDPKQEKPQEVKGQTERNKPSEKAAHKEKSKEKEKSEERDIVSLELQKYDGKKSEEIVKKVEKVKEQTKNAEELIKEKQSKEANKTR